MSSKFYIEPGDNGFAVNLDDVRAIDMVRDTTYETSETVDIEGKGLFGRAVVYKKIVLKWIPRFTVAIQFRGGGDIRYNGDTREEAQGFHDRIVAAAATV